MGSPEGQHSSRRSIWPSMRYSDVDARRRKSSGPTGNDYRSRSRRNVSMPSIRICPATYRNSRVRLAGRLRAESYTDEQMEEFDQLMEPWLEDYERKRSAVGK